MAGALAGALWAGIAGFLKATRGVHEVISTIMLNWIAVWVGTFLFSLGGPLQNDTQPFVPVSNDILDEAKLSVLWGDPFLQALHVGFFVSLAALVVYWITLNRTTLGYEVRAVGFNPEAARYGGISVARNYFLAMAISGLFAGLAGRDRHPRLAVPDQHERRPDLVADRASSGSRSRCSGGTRRSAWACRPCSSPRSPSARRRGTSTRRSSRRSSPRT